MGYVARNILNCASKIKSDPTLAHSPVFCLVHGLLPEVHAAFGNGFFQKNLSGNKK